MNERQTKWLDYEEWLTHINWYRERSWEAIKDYFENRSKNENNN